KTAASEVQVSRVLGETCHNCGLFSDCVSSGVRIALTIRAGAYRPRDSKRTIWCCSDECAIQALGIARFGPAASKWPITLSQFRSTNPLAELKRSNVTKTPQKVVDSKGPKDGILATLTQEPMEGVFVTQKPIV